MSLDYVILEEETPADLQREVNRAIKHGYAPQGGVSVGPSDLFKGGVSYAQAMVRQDD